MFNLTANSGGISAGVFGHLRFENMTIYGNGGAGLWARTYDSVYMVNCDVYANCDSLDAGSPGGDGDGFVASARGGSNGDNSDTTRVTYIEGCRAYWNSDDGFDIGTIKQLVFINNWSFANGRMNGDGTGLKLSYSWMLDQNSRVVSNNITAYNQKEGDLSGAGMSETNLYDEVRGPRANYFNNFSYKDYCSYTHALGYWHCDSIFFAKDVYRNNISYAPTNPSGTQAFFGCCDYGDPSPYVVASDNTFLIGELAAAVNNPAFTVTDDDFVSLDSAELRLPRKSSGALPDITFSRLVGGSDMKSEGMDVGMSSTPDIGIDWAYLDSNLGIDSTATNITGFVLSEQESASVIDTVNHTVTIKVTYGTSLTSLSPTILLDEGATISPTSGTATNFTSPVEYTVTALDGITTQVWTVTVTVDESADAPTLTTSAVTIKTAISAILGGNVSSTGGAAITARGICWGTSANPTTSNNVIPRNGQTGSFTAVLRGLSGGTTYYVRSFATNSAGTSYGSQVSFTTPNYSPAKHNGLVIVQNGKIIIER